MEQLVQLNRTAHAAKLEKMSDDAVVAEAMGVLRAEFGRRIPDPIAMQRSKWGANEFSQGTLAHVPPGASAEDRRDLRRIQHASHRRVLVGSSRGGATGG